MREARLVEEGARDVVARAFDEAVRDGPEVEADPGGVDELYDLEADPHEITNLLDAPTYRQRCDALRALLYDRMERYEDPYAQNRYGAPRYLLRPASNTEWHTVLSKA